MSFVLVPVSQAKLGRGVGARANEGHPTAGKCWQASYQALPGRVPSTHPSFAALLTVPVPLDFVVILWGAVTRHLCGLPHTAPLVTYTLSA